MQRERITVSLDSRTAERVRQCGARSHGGASGYLERLVRQDALGEAVEQHARWFAANPSWLADAEAERDAAADEDAA
jgi:hypothetical protein